MSVKQPAKCDSSEATGASRRAWTRPSLTPLRAGRAEAIPGAAIADGVLETIGS